MELQTSLPPKPSPLLLIFSPSFRTLPHPHRFPQMSKNLQPRVDIIQRNNLQQNATGNFGFSGEKGSEVILMLLIFFNQLQKGPFMRECTSVKCFKSCFAVPQEHAQLIFFPSFGRSRLHSSSTHPCNCCLGLYYILPVEHTDGGAKTRTHTLTCTVLNDTVILRNPKLVQ